MKKRPYFWIVTCCLLFSVLTGNSLVAQLPQTIEIGPYGGITAYAGDINPSASEIAHLKLWQPFILFDYDLGGVVRYNYDSRWAFRLDYTYATIKGSDEAAQWRPERDLSFISKVHAVDAVVEFNFLDYYTGRMGSTFSPYIFAGGSLFWYKTGPYIADEETLLQIPGTTDAQQLKDFKKAWAQSIGKGRSFAIPFGVGFKLSLSQHVAASLEYQMHYTFTDELDGVSTRCPSDSNHKLFVSHSYVDDQGKNKTDYLTVTGDPNTLANGYTFLYDLTDPKGNFSEGQQLGNTMTNDWFGVLNLSVTWKFVIPNSSACKITNN